MGSRSYTKNESYQRYLFQEPYSADGGANGPAEAAPVRTKAGGEYYKIPDKPDFGKLYFNPELRSPRDE